MQETIATARARNNAYDFPPADSEYLGRILAKRISRIAKDELLRNGENVVMPIEKDTARAVGREASEGELRKERGKNVAVRECMS